jgi:hypothetical protein
MSSEPKIDEVIEVASRTLRAAGYEVFEFQRSLNRAEFRCRISSRLGAVIRFMFCFTSGDEFPDNQIEELQHLAESQALSLILVSQKGSEGGMSWSDFLRAMGGAVPSWRALQTNFRHALLVASRNKLPEDEVGEAWALFEDLIRDGLEFVLGRKVRSFGGRRRGQKVSDMIAQLPNFDLLVVDAKATEKCFDASWPQMRPLVEYVKKQQLRQSGLNNVIAALIVSSQFKQNEHQLRGISDAFIAETRVPACFMTAETLAILIETFRASPLLRNAVQWSAVFTGGLVAEDKVLKLIEEARSEYVEGRDL